MKKKIYVSLCGYLPRMRKTAVCLCTGDSFSIVDVSDKQTVYSGPLSEPYEDPDSGDTVRKADFSDFDRKGTYYIKCGYRRSEAFVIDDEAYSTLKKLLLCGMKLNRCGYDLYRSDSTAAFKGFAHGKCHNDLTQLFFGEQLMNVSGGWHCGGGYGKYTTVTALTCAFLLYSYRLYPESFTSDDEAALPEILDECRWGLEWLLKMQAPDGGVYHKCDVSERLTSPLSADNDDETYYIFPESSQAAVVFTAVTALAVPIYEKYDRMFARQLSRAASNAWLWIVNSSKYEPWNIPTGSSSTGLGDFSDPDDSDDLLWMMSEMYALTGDESFLRSFKELIYKTDSTGFSFNSIGGLASISCLMNSDFNDPTLDFYIKKKFGDRADKLASAALSGYGNALSVRSDLSGYGEYSNMNVISDCIVCQTAYMIFGMQKYLDAAASMIQYILGINPIGISYITGSAEDCPSQPRHAGSRTSDHSGPCPGLIVGGPNYFRSDDFTRWKLNRSTPPAKCYIDNVCSISTNEPSLCLSAAALLSAAFFDRNGSRSFDLAINS